MTCETPTIRPLRRTDFPALEELIRLAWYDDGNDSHNTHDEVGQAAGPDKRRAELRKATRLRNMHRLAAIDMQDCLARTTKAYVAELNGQVLGVILGSLRSDITGRQRDTPYAAPTLPHVAVAGKPRGTSRSACAAGHSAGRRGVET